MMQPKPFLKWAGGKGKLLTDLLACLPARYTDYYEPFLGGGALFFRLSQTLKGDAFLSDLNSDLINAYEVVRQDKCKLITELTKHAKSHSAEYYYLMRASGPATKVERAARLIYLNKTCFNGIYRVNSKGAFNVPMGRYAKPTILDAENIEACANALRNVNISTGNFSDIRPKKKSLVYFDPPYDVPENTQGFTSYTKDGFSRIQQADLQKFASSLVKKGMFVVLSNSDTCFIRELYADFRVTPLVVGRSISCKDRKPANELLIMGGF